MNSKITVRILTIALTAAGILRVYADEVKPVTMTSSTTMTTNATTIAASAVISPGRYSVSVAPSFNSAMSDRLVKALGKIEGIGSVAAKAVDSTIHFTVKNGSKVHLADIQQVVAKADTGAVISTPILEHSMTANPGL